MRGRSSGGFGKVIKGEIAFPLGGGGGSGVPREPPEEAGLNLGVGLWGGGTQVGIDPMSRPSLAQEENRVRPGGLWRPTRLFSHQGTESLARGPRSKIPYKGTPLSAEWIHRGMWAILACTHSYYKAQGVTRCRGERVPIPAPPPRACGWHPRGPWQAGASLPLPRLREHQGQ